MKYRITAVPILLTLAAAFAPCSHSSDSTPADSQHTVLTEEIPFADPTIVCENGVYYLTGTNSDAGFTMLQSDDLKLWRPVDNGHDGRILTRGDGTWGEHSFWAPQVFCDNGRYYLTYSAQGKMCVAQSDTICGPYRQVEERPVDDCDEMNIDTFLFRDDDGKYYMFHARYEMQGEAGGNTIQVAEYDIDADRLVPGTLRLIAKVSEPWELTDNGKKFINRTLEGPTVIKLDGKYYLFYSANDYQSIDYAMGYAVADNPYGPWTKHESNPVIHRSLVGENGSGHGDFFISKEGRPYYVYHVHQSDTAIHPRKVRIAPLNMTKNPKTGVYDISIDTTAIIRPVMTK